MDIIKFPFKKDALPKAMWQLDLGKFNFSIVPAIKGKETLIPLNVGYKDYMKGFRISLWKYNLFFCYFLKRSKNSP